MHKEQDACTQQKRFKSYSRRKARQAFADGTMAWRRGLKSGFPRCLKNVAACASTAKEQAMMKSLARRVAWETAERFWSEL